MGFPNTSLHSSCAWNRASEIRRWRMSPVHTIIPITTAIHHRTPIVHFLLVHILNIRMFLRRPRRR